MRHWSLRARVTGVATVAVALVLVVLAVVLVHALRVGLTNRVDRQLRADDAAVTDLPVAIERVPAAAIGGRILQVVDTDGTVVWSSTAAGGDEATPLLADPLPLDPGGGTQIVSVDDPVLGELRVLAVPHGDGDDRWLLIARSEELAVTAARSVLRGVVILVPLLSVGVGLIVWFGVGRALRPVESIRSTVGDITEHHLSTRVPVPDTGDEIARLAVTMNEMLDRLDAASGRERRLVADASHELRSPLASVRALLETRATAADPAAHDAEAMAAVIRLQGLVEQLLELASQDAAMPIDGRAVDVDDLVVERASALRTTTDLRVDAGAVSGGQVVGSAEGLRRVVDNLAANAGRHARTTVRFEVREVPGWVQLVVADDGPGIPEAERARVFERFTRLDEARDRDRAGAGLGLSIVAGEVARHHGTVSVDADPTLGGARFVVHLPRPSPPPEASSARTVDPR
jgi:signal transduction histidine kinase